MTRILQVTGLISIWSMTLLPSIAQAQTKCPAGNAINGGCADESMAKSARQAAVIFSQPKISFTAYPVLPSADRLYRYPNQLMPDQLRLTPRGPGPGFEFPGGTTGFP
jgi:hypothetical protein